MDAIDALEVHYFEPKKRVGVNSDGGYVICMMEGGYDCYISCGVANEASFDRDFLALYDIGKSNSFAFDGTIDGYPHHYTQEITFIRKNIANFNDDSNTNLADIVEKYDQIFLSMDIEGGEYPWLLSLSNAELSKFKQICIEFHGLSCGGWGANDREKGDCLRKLKATHYLMHAHGNNYSAVNKTIPDVLELTYVNKKYLLQVPVKNVIPLPIKGLDFPNCCIEDHQLGGYPFTSKGKSIEIGASETNSKTVNLVGYPPNAKFFFVHQYKDTFSYVLERDTLTVRRTDENQGWGQQLIATYVPVMAYEGIYYMWYFKPNETNVMPDDVIRSNQTFISDYKVVRPENMSEIFEKENTEIFPGLYELYDSIPNWIVKADLARLLVIYYNGGTYCDVDCFIRKPLNIYAYNIVLFTEKICGDVNELGPKECKHPDNKVRVANYCFYSKKPGHPFIKAVIDECLRRLRQECNKMDALDVLWCCGPDVITTVFHRRKHDFKDVLLCDESFLDHRCYGSWR